MKKMAVFFSLILLLQTTTVLANEIDRDPFTTFVQEILIDLGLLDTPATGVNDKATQKAIMSFQEKAGLEKIDGIVGGETFPKLLQGETAYTTTTTFVDTHPPKWAEDPLSVINVNNNWAAPTVMRATILWGHVTDNIGIDEYQIYVDGELYTTIPGKNCKTKCSSQSSGVNARITNLIKDNYHTIEVRACDEAGNCSTNNPTMTKQFKKTTQVSTTSTTTTTIPGTPSITITASEVSDGDTSSDSSLSLTFTTSASTTDFAAGDVSVSGGTLSNFSGSGTTYTATFTPTAQGATTIDVASSTFTDASTGVDNTAATQFNWTYSTAPTITITAAEVSDGGTSSDSSLSLTFTASQSTTNFAAGDVVVSGGTLSNFSGSGTTYTATFTPSAEGATTIDVAANTFTNAFSTNNTAATQFNWTYAEFSKLATCGDSTTNANRWVVAVIDEDQNGRFSISSNWTSDGLPGFRDSYPNRCFHVLEPFRAYNMNFSTPNGINSNLSIPPSFISELSAGTTFHARVSRMDQYNTISGTSDWWDLIGASVLPSGAKIGLCIDNSGSMYASTVQDSLDLFEQKAAAAGVTITPGNNADSTTYYCSGMSNHEWLSGLKIDIN